MPFGQGLIPVQAMQCDLCSPFPQLTRSPFSPWSPLAPCCPSKPRSPCGEEGAGSKSSGGTSPEEPFLRSQHSLPLPYLGSHEPLLPRDTGCSRQPQFSLRDEADIYEPLDAHPPRSTVLARCLPARPSFLAAPSAPAALALPAGAKQGSVLSPAPPSGTREDPVTRVCVNPLQG